MSEPGRSAALFVHHRDLSTPIGKTVAYYLADRFTESHTVHVVCRARADEHGGDDVQRATLHRVDTGEVPVVSTILFHVAACLYVAVLGLRHRYDAVYAFPSSIVQGQLGAWAAGATLVVALVSVPVRQRRDMTDFSGDRPGPRERLVRALLALYAAVVGRVLQRCGAVVCLTDGIREVTETVYDLDLSDAHVIGMGVDVRTFARAADAAERSGDPAITYVGNVSETRRLGRVLEALAALDRDLTFRVAGGGPDEDVRQFLERAEQLGVREQVDWLGMVPHEEIPGLLARSALTVSPLPDIESYRVSFPAKLLEYMAAGTRVVATDIRPHRTLIEDGANGYLYDGSVDGLAATIERALDDPDGPAVERRARATAEGYDWDVVAAAYEAVAFEEEAGESGAAVGRAEGRRRRSQG